MDCKKRVGNRLLTMVLVMALVFTSVHLPVSTVQAAENDDYTAPVGVVVQYYPIEGNVIRISWGFTGEVIPTHYEISVDGDIYTATEGQILMPNIYTFGKPYNEIFTGGITVTAVYADGNRSDATPVQEGDKGQLWTQANVVNLQNVVTQFLTVTGEGEKYNAFKDALEAAAAVEAGAANDDIYAAFNNLYSTYIAFAKEKLGALVQEYKTVEEKNVSVTSWTALQEAIDHADEVLGLAEQNNVTAEDMKSAIDGLETAGNNLAVDKTELNHVMTDYQTVEGDENSEKFQAFQDAYEAAQGLVEKEYPEVTQEEINQAVEAVKTTYVTYVQEKLKDALEEYSNLKKGTNADDIWTNFENAKEQAETIAESTEPTAEEVQTALDNLNAAYEALTDKTTVDKTKLKDAIADYKTTAEATEIGDAEYDAFKSAYDEAVDVNENVTATQEQVDTALDNVKNAYLTYVKSELEETIAESEYLGKGDNTDEDWNAFRDALDHAKDVAANQNATAEQMKDAVDALKTAYDKVLEKSNVDKTELQKVIEKYSDVTDTTENAAYVEFKKAYDEAVKVDADETATQEEVKKAIADVKNAYLVYGKSELENLVNSYKELEQGDNADDIWTNFTGTLGEAETVLVNPNATADEIKDVIDALKQAYNTLTDKGAADKTELQKIVEKYKDVSGEADDAKYTAFKSAYDVAKELLNSVTADQSEIDKAVVDVKGAYFEYIQAILTAEIEAYVAMEQLAYTETTWRAFQKAIVAAQDALVKPEVTADSLDEAHIALKTAYEALAEKEGLWIREIPDQIYTGAQIKPAVEVWDGNVKLTNKQSYTVTYRYNTNVGTATVTVKGKGNYRDKDTETFRILPKKLDNTDDTKNCVTATNIYSVINKKGDFKTPKIVVKYGKKALKAGKDYIVEGLDKVTGAGSYTLTLKAIEGDGKNYAAATTITYDVLPYEAKLMNKAQVTLDTNVVEYKGDKTVKPVVTNVRIAGTDLTTDQYTVDISGDIQIGKMTLTVLGVREKGVYGSKKVTYTVTGTKLTNANIEIADITAQPYTVSESGVVLGEKLKVYDKNKTVGEGDNAGLYQLIENKDFTVVAYSKNTKAGNAKVTIEGIGAYTGKMSKSFVIHKVNLTDYKNNPELKWDCVDKTEYTKDGARPSFTLTYMGKELVAKKDYTVSYKDNKAVAGTATIIVKGKGNYTGEITDSYTVAEPKATTIYAEAVDAKIPNSPEKVKTKIKVKEKATGKVLKANTDYEKTFDYYILEADGTKRDITAEDLSKSEVRVHVCITLKNNYAGTGETAQTVETSFRLYSKKASTFVVEKIPDEVYTGKDIEPEVKVYADRTKTKKLEKGVDYDVTYDKNVNKGSAKAIITGIGNGYGGTKTVRFRIVQHDLHWEWKEDIAEKISNFFHNFF